MSILSGNSAASRREPHVPKKISSQYLYLLFQLFFNIKVSEGNECNDTCRFVGLQIYFLVCCSKRILKIGEHAKLWAKIIERLVDIDSEGI